MLKKRSIIFLMIMAMALTLLAGCGSKTPEATPEPTAEPEIEVVAEPERKEYTTVELAEYVGARTVTVNADDSVGSGFFIDSEGTLVTNYHVIEGAKKITVDVDGGNYTVSEIVDFSKVYDLAILKIEKSDTPYLERCAEVKTGEPVYAVGSSLGILAGSSPAALFLPRNVCTARSSASRWMLLSQAATAAARW